MEKVKKLFPLRLGIVAVMFITSLMLMDRLPETVPTHWDINGNVDDYGPKWVSLYLMPGMALFFIFLFPLLAKIDPRRKNYAKFPLAWEMIQSVIILFLGYFHLVMLYLSIHQDKSNLMPAFMFAGIGVMFLLLGYYMMQVKQNYFVGLKTPWTLDDPKVWDMSHKFTGKVFMLAGLVMIAEAWLQVYMTVALFGVILAAALLPVVHSYLIWRKRH